MTVSREEPVEKYWARMPAASSAREPPASPPSDTRHGNNLFTPLQLANYVATLVNGGDHYACHLLKASVTLSRPWPYPYQHRGW